MRQSSIYVVLPKWTTNMLGVCALSVTLGACESAPRGHSSDEPIIAGKQAALEQAPYYYRLGKRLEANVPLDRIGLVTARPGSRQAITELAGRYGLKIADVHQDSFYVLSTGNPRERPALETLAESLKRDPVGARLISETGLIMLEGKDATPVLLPTLFIARFDPKLSRAEVEAFNAPYGVSVVGKDTYAPNQYLLRVKAGGALGVMHTSAQYEEDAAVLFAHPNFWRLNRAFDQTPFDPFFGDQWHHRNGGASGGLVDADADTSWAWDYGYGSTGVVIAVMDEGVETTHPDLSANIFANGAEVAGNGVDDDGNGLVDDVNGWDFASCGSSTLPCGDNDANPALTTDNHGTAVAGVAAARANNATGVAGGCPNCKIMPLRVSWATLSDQAMINVFGYVAAMGVDIMNNSWGYTSPSAMVSTAVATAIADAANAGTLVLFAAGNGDDDGWCVGSFPSLDDSVMAVSSSTNLDKKVTESAWGDCVDILAPSHRGYFAPYNGTLNVTTTDRVGAPGYNSDDPSGITCAVAEPANTDYSHCFGGTSSATPLVAGIAGLIKSADPSMSRTDIQRLIQDSADKIVDSVADYNDNTGLSTPLTHSWGRVNAHEALRVAALAGNNAHAGVDVFLRDNRLDWGNTTGYLGEQSSGVNFESPRTSIAHWVSRDIKVDAPPYAAAPTAATFDAFVDEKPSLAPGDVNRVYVRVRNRGRLDATNVDIKLMWTQFGTSLPPLNADFWTAYPADSALPANPWTSALCQGTATPYCTVASVAYSGATLAGSAADVAQIAAFDMPAPTFDPSKANHYCLLAVADADNDHVDPITQGIFAPDSITPNDNNVTHRNYHDLDTSVAGSFSIPFYIRNPFRQEARTRIVLWGDKRLLESVGVKPSGFVFDQVFSMKPFSEKLVRVSVQVPAGAAGELSIAQQNYQKQQFQTVGGLTFDLGKHEK